MLAVGPWLGLLLAACSGGEPGTNDADATAADGSAGSDGSEGSGGSDDGPADLPPRAPGMEGVHVGLDTAPQPFAVSCQAHPEGQVAGVAPNGELWLTAAAADGSTLLAIDTDGTLRSWSLPWVPQAVVGWSRDAATLSTADGIWTIADGVVDPVRWIDGAQGPSAFCGDPAREGDGLVIAGDVYTRDLGQWWRWNLPGAPVGPSDALATVVGACAGASDTTWIRRGETVWSIQTDWFGQVTELSPSSAIAVDESFGVASLVDGVVITRDVDEALTEISFEAGDAERIASAPGALWTVVGERVYRMRAGAFVEARRVPDAALAPTELWLDATGGGWIATEDSLCRIDAPGAPTVAIDGLREYERRRTDTLSVTIDVSGSDAPAVALDGEAVDVEADETGAYALELEGLTQGWHALTVAVPQAEPREIPFAVEHLVPATWEDDIVPLFEEHCAGDACHGPDPVAATQPDLSEYAGWETLADAVAARVVSTGDMPPLAAREDSWGVDDVLLISGWLDAGLPRKEEP